MTTPPTNGMANAVDQRAPAAWRVPVVHERGCTWHQADPTVCVEHRAPMVGIPMPHTTRTETQVRVCTKMLRKAADLARRTAQPTSAMDQLAARMDTDFRRPGEPSRDWGTASHYVAALRTLRALPCLDNRTVDRLAARAWDEMPFESNTPEDLVRALLDALAEEADRA